MIRPEQVLADEFVKARMDLAFPDGEEGEPFVTIGSEVLTVMRGLWKRCMIVKVLGRNIPIAAMSRKLRELWKPKGAMHVTDLPRQFFMVRFDMEEEYMEALTGGPWKVFGSYLMVQDWSPDFDPMRDEITTTPVWVRLSNIPMLFYHRQILMGIAEGLGKPLKVDLTTQNLDRARFARVCVEVNLKKPLKGTIMVNDERFFVSYEGLSSICSACGLYGHLVHACPKTMQEKLVASQTTQSTQELNQNVVSQPNDGFRLVRRNSRRTEKPQSCENTVPEASGEAGRNLREITTGRDSGNIAISNRFGNLDTQLEASELREGNSICVSDKENAGVGDPRSKGKGGKQVT
ncbi:uncharacterized protein LOC17885862 [Capsella rubella]|uniref:uncharacterized protein LOC17885862 n=1 Tax=Capsella rubella TaxID=81985 RepID=UPI000CD58D5C|nr:uncharacterized protein LOC17885862 [Capsella rubella]